jgi:transposase
MKITTIGLDTAKNVFHWCAEDGTGELSYGKLQRRHVLRHFAQLPQGRIILEACGGAHYWARELVALGHMVEQLPAQETAKFRHGVQKNDYRDAHALVRASKDSAIYRVSVKNPEQQRMQALHRVRELTKKNRHQALMQIRGFLSEVGVTLPKSVAGLRRSLPEALEDERCEVLKDIVEQLYEEFVHQDDRLERVTLELKRLAKADELCRKLMARRGIGEITASYVVGSVPISAFRGARNFAAWVGMVPRQYSTGGRTKLGGITKGGNRYLRSLFIHGGRSLLRSLGDRDDEFSQWARSVWKRRGFNVAAVAVAHKLARQTWAILQPASAA